MYSTYINVGIVWQIIKLAYLSHPVSFFYPITNALKLSPPADLRLVQILPLIFQWSAHSTRQLTFWYNKITGWAQDKRYVKWGKFWGCKTSFALDIQKPLARHYSLQILLLELSTAIGTILKAQRQRYSNDRQWLCSCPCSALCSVHWTNQPHLHVCRYVL
jgi:hypothetical protein